MVAAPAPTAKQAEALKDALADLRARRWDAALKRAEAMGDEAAQKLVTWFVLADLRHEPGFAALSAFITANPTWPRLGYLQARAEEALRHSGDDAAALVWLTEHPPRTTAGKVRLAEALLATGHREEGVLAIRDAWVNGSFSRADEARFRGRHGKLLASDDDLARLDRLLWDGESDAARRMLLRVDGATRLVGEARMLLRMRSGNVDSAIAKVPAELRDDPGLIYERLRWRRAKGRDLDALELLREPPENLVRPDLWSTEKLILARRLLQAGHISEAYRLAQDHRLEDGIGFAESEWLAGWIALRFLGDSDVAFDHFERLYNGVSYPISLARAAYWAGRAAEAMGNVTQQHHWYTAAAAQATTYYGQLAAARMKPEGGLSLPAAPVVDDGMRQRFARSDLVHAVAWLLAAGEEDELAPFIRALGTVEESPAWRKLTASLAHAAGRPDLAIRVAKDGAPDGVVLIEEAYPVIEPPPPPHINDKLRLETPLLHAVVRQESAFYTRAVSGADARGLMQILPSTAKGVAQSLNIPYSPQKLISDPDYNLTLGQAYLAGLLNDFGGSYVLALAAYNAGPGRARQWVRDFGHPRDSSVDVIDWIEMIPFPETRNYVQRVLENLQVYRDRLNPTEVAENLQTVLER